MLALIFARLQRNHIKNLAASLLLDSETEDLDLSNRKLDDELARLLCPGISHNKSITFLDLSQNQIGDAGSAAIGEALRQNDCITQISLAENKVDLQGLASLVASLQSNKSVIRVDLEENAFDSQSDEATASLNLLKDILGVHICSSSLSF